MPLRQTAIIFALLLVTACASLVAPRVSAEPAALREGAYRLDRDHAALLFKVGHLGFSKFIGRFEEFDVALDFDESDPTAARIDATIDMNSLNVANPDFAETLTGPGWFDAAAFPEARFRSTEIEVTGENQGVLHGELTMKGITQPVSLDVTFNGAGYDMIRGAYVLGMSAEGEFKRSDFGVSRFRPLVRNTVELEIEAEFLREGPPPDEDDIAESAASSVLTLPWAANDNIEATED